MNPNTAFELFTRRVYQILAFSNALPHNRVQHNVKLKGNSGCKHQIDVLWEYEFEGKMHRVAIECKNYNSQIPIGKVRDFFGVLHDLNDIRGIMVSSKGYQEGAKKFADHYGISLKALRRPGLNETIGSVTTTTLTDVRHCLFLIDEMWIAEHSFSLETYRNKIANLSFNKADYWRTATHVPIETADRYIRDSNSTIISRLDSLGLMLLEKQEPGTVLLFPFKDGWVQSRYWGPVKIREVKYEYENSVQETTINLAAEDFVEAILEDALNGKTDIIPKY